MEDFQKESREIKGKFQLQRTVGTRGREGTQVIAIVLGVRGDANHTVDIPCRNGYHLNDAVYDITKDCYNIHCVDFLDLGCLPVIYTLQVADVLGWVTYLPLPENVIKRYLSMEALEYFEAWKEKFNSSDYKVKFLQTIEMG